MVNIYNYLKNVWLKERENNLFVLLISLILISIPLPYIYSSIATIIFAFFAFLELFYTKKTYFNKRMLYPILLYFLMFLSLFWTIDIQLTKEALVKELALFALPICFMFLDLKNDIKSKIVSIYSYSMTFYCIYYLLNALIKYAITSDAEVFFYHNLVTLDVNAIHVSVYLSISCFYFIQKKEKLFIDYVALFVLMLTITLLSSKNVIITFYFLLLLYFIFYKNNSVVPKYIVFMGITFVGILIIFPNKIKDRFLIEIQSNQNKKTLAKGFNNENVYNVTVVEAWSKEKFEPNDYFPGTALRVYQIRIFKELLQQEGIFFNGYGLNASWKKIEQKRIEHNLFKGYEKFNFHNQYIQNFAELGVFGFLLLVLILALSLKNAIKNKDFIHFSFTILMISLFLTESFLWRQRGVLFFTMLYCLFNTKYSVTKS